MTIKFLQIILIGLGLIFSLPLLAQIQVGADIDGVEISEESGSSVSLSANGTRVAIGAPSNMVNGSGTGQVRVYNINNGNWTQVGGNIDGALSGDRFGSAVSISSSGDRVAISAPFSDGNGSNSGSVGVYELQGNNWIQLGMDIIGEASSDLSGWSVDLSNDGTRLAIGAIQNVGSSYQAGHVRVYELNNGNWTQLGGDINGEANGDYSGESVSFSADGTRLAIGATFNGGSGYNAGHVRIYQFNGSNWTQLGTDVDGEGQYDRSGKSVSMSADGNRVAIGAYANTNANNSTSGHVRVYEWSSNNWIQLGMDIDGSNGGGLRFGWDLSLSSDGNRVAIGAFLSTNESGNNAGNVQVYDFENGDWNQVYNNMFGEAATDESGQSVSLSADGNRVAIGAKNNDGNGDNAGHVRIYELTNCMNTASTDEITSCESYTWIDGNIYGESNNTATYTIPNTLGCDSIINLNLIIAESTTKELVESACDEFTLNGETYNTTGIYNQTLMNVLGCDSLITLDLTIQVLDTGVTQVNDELMATATGASYQWINCDNNQLVEGANQQSFIPSTSGNYAVEITTNGCSETSECFNLILSSIKENSFPNQILVFPNPVSDVTNVELGETYAKIEVTVFNILGEQLFVRHLVNTNQFRIDTRTYPSGNYIVKLKTEEYEAVIQLLKE